MLTLLSIVTTESRKNNDKCSYFPLNLQKLAYSFYSIRILYMPAVCLASIASWLSLTHQYCRCLALSPSFPIDFFEGMCTTLSPKSASVFVTRCCGVNVMLDCLAIVYVAIVVSAFMMLLVESVASASLTGTTQEALLKKDKTKLPFPVSPELSTCTNCFQPLTWTFRVVSFVSGAIGQLRPISCMQSR